MTATRVFLVLFSLLSLVLNIAGQICVPDAAGATAVYGTTTFTAAGTLTGATGVHIERATGTNQGKVWVVLTTSNTVARYTSAYSLASVAAPEFTLAATNGGTPSLSAPTYITTDSAGTCYLSDTSNNRVLLFGSCYSIASATTGPTGVLGQATLTAFGAGATAGTTTNLPRGIGFDSTIGTPTITNPVFVVNSGFNEIIQFAATITSGTTLAASTQSYGSGTAAGGATNGDLSGPFGMAYAQAIDVMYIADTGNSRIMVVTAARAATGAATGTIFGATVGCSATQISGAKGVSYDVTNNILYIADTVNNRVLYVTTAAGVLPATITGQMFPNQATAPATCATSGLTQNGAILPVDVDVVPVGTFAPTSAGGPTLVFSDSTNARLVKVCSGTFSGSITVSQSLAVLSISPSLSASGGAVAGVSPSLSASIGSAGLSASLSTSFGSAAGGTSVSLSASAAGGTSSSSSISVTVTVTGTVTVTATNSFSATNSQSFSLTVSRSFSITVSQSYSITVSTSYTPSYTNSYTNSITTSVTNSYSASKAKYCGNGIVEGFEQCDLGTTNGQKHVCCSKRCRNKKGGRRCYRQKNECLSHPRCDGRGNCRSAEFHEDAPCKLTTGLTGKCNGSGQCIA